MISSRWPRPIGIRASIALSPVCIGSCTERRGMMPGALTSTRRRSVASIGPLPSSGVAERVDHAAEQALADRHVDDRLGPLDHAALADVAVVAEDHHADVVGLEVERHAAGAVLELDHLAGLDLVEAVDPRDAVADRQHAADLGDLGLGAEVGDLLLQDGGDLGGADVHQAAPFSASSSWCSLVRIEASIIREPSRTTSPPSRLGSTARRQLHGLAHGGGQLALDALQLGRGQGHGGDHLGADLALVLGEHGVIGLDHVRQARTAGACGRAPRGTAGSAGRSRPARRARRSPGPARRATAPGCGSDAPDPRSRSIMSLRPCRSQGDRVERVPVLGKLEQGRGIATRQARRMHRCCWQTLSLRRSAD